ncbi:hypothetical protein AB0C76_03265 [Kitasatospora sp. NPDC048722]|uniref:hypothetical protein n=1 Tax=Kitasatospora sp. NPDC048722 TaxID=3155639 RepID=UPI00340AF401
MAKEFRTTADSLNSIRTQVDLWRSWLLGNVPPAGAPAHADGDKHTNLIRQIQAFAAGGDGLGTVDNPDGYSKLLGALEMQTSTQMQTDFQNFTKAVKAQLDAIVKSLDRVSDGLDLATVKFATGEEHALSAAEMFTILSGSPNTSSTNPVTPPPVPPTTPPKA